MGFAITIGEGYLDVPTEGNGNEPRCRVRPMTHEFAPDYPGDIGSKKSNQRSPSYGAWDAFVTGVGLRDLFFGASWEDNGGTITRDTCLFPSHPGAALLRRPDLREIQAAKGRWLEQPWPTKERIPGFSRDDPRYDGNLARLLWLAWWVDWALENCKVPVIENA